MSTSRVERCSVETQYQVPEVHDGCEAKHMRAVTPNSSDDVPTTMGYGGAADPSKSQVDGLKYKTRVCRNFEEKGECPYESRCMFAHGQHELRTVQQNHNEGIISEEDIKRFRRATGGSQVQAPPGHHEVSRRGYYSHTPYAYSAPHQSDYSYGYYGTPYGWNGYNHQQCHCPSCVPPTCPCAECAASMYTEHTQCMCAQCVQIDIPRGAYSSSHVLHHGNVNPGAVFEP